MKAEIQKALNSLYHNDSIGVELLNQVISYIEKLENHIRYKTIPVEYIEHRIGLYEDWHEDVEPLVNMLKDWMDYGRDEYEDISIEL